MCECPPAPLELRPTINENKHMNKGTRGLLKLACICTGRAQPVRFLQPVTKDEGEVNSEREAETMAGQLVPSHACFVLSAG